MLTGQFPMVEASMEPSHLVTRARVYFRSSLGIEDYFVEMTLQDGKFVGKLPKPKIEASPITYFIRATGDDGESETPRIEAKVVDSASDCAEGSLVAPVGGPGAVTVLRAATGLPATTTHGPCAYGDPAWRGNLKLGVPQKASLMVGFVFARETGQCRKGFMLAVEPGIGGGKLSLGYSKTSPTSRDVAYRTAKITFLRTWKPWLADDKANYLGVEVSSTLWFSELPFVGSLGLLRRVGARAGSRDWVVTAGIGFGV